MVKIAAADVRIAPQPSLTKEGVFSEHTVFFFFLIRIKYQQHLETARLAQGKLWATYESSEAVPHLRTPPHSGVARPQSSTAAASA